MKVIPLKVLKQNLSRFTEEAAAGEEIEVTRYNKPFVRLISARHPALHVGARVGKGTIRPIGKRLTKGAYLAVLGADRDDDRG